jgi:hypothetical protein
LSFPVFDAQPGLINRIGEYDQCLSVESPPDYSKEIPIIRGQYCKAQIVFPMPANEDWNINEPFDNYLNEIFNNIETNGSFIKNLLNNGVTPTVVQLMVQGLNLIHDEVEFVGLCVPSGCQAKHLQEAINKGKI